jgi:ABC-type dipeptide/oligopeptide/nickel transport system permease component
VTSSLLTVPDLVLFLTLLLVAVRTGWFPTGGMMSAGFDDLGVAGKVKDLAIHLSLPALGLVLATLPPLVRHVRSAMIEVLEAPFVRAARAHGIPESRVLLRCALPVGANPLYEAAVMGLVSGDADPTSEMNVWLSSGETYLWHPRQEKPSTPWE